MEASRFHSARPRLEHARRPPGALLSAGAVGGLRAGPVAPPHGRGHGCRAGRRRAWRPDVGRARGLGDRGSQAGAAVGNRHQRRRRHLRRARAQLPALPALRVSRGLRCRRRAHRADARTRDDDPRGAAQLAASRGRVVRNGHARGSGACVAAAARRRARLAHAVRADCAAGPACARGDGRSAALGALLGGDGRHGDCRAGAARLGGARRRRRAVLRGAGPAGGRAAARAGRRVGCRCPRVH
mmetsp:Transcript_17236/g.60571  ORF Transcript_17236/g.60571 Transcript_17236/m.60571 type:complete len:242 (-) Transcript_17236:1724-2449(-)